MSDEVQAPEAEAKPAKVKVISPTIARDASVLELVQGAGETGVTRKDVVAHVHATEPDVSASQAYLTLSRLRAAGKGVERRFVDGVHRWFASAAA